MRVWRGAWLCGLLAMGCPAKQKPEPGLEERGEAQTAQQAPTPEEARAFLERLEPRLRELSVQAARAEWENSTNITDGSERMAAQANEALMAFASEAIEEAARFRDVTGLSAEEARMFELLRRGASLPAPPDPEKRQELAALATKLESLYAKGKYCKGPEPESCRDLEQLSDVFATSRDYDELYDAWQGWHQVGRELRPLYQRYVSLANEGAQSIGYRDVGELWRAGYDMSPAEFSRMEDALYEQVRPLYEALHCYVRSRLASVYGSERVPPSGLIPAHLLGNMWAQEWASLYPVLEPFRGQGELDVTRALVRQKYDELRMAKLAEGFFVSLGFEPLPATFYERSMFRKPSEREVVCHASAWDVTYDNDLRIKMCIKVTYEDLITIHHELGHNYYFSAYHKLPILFQDGANDGFHEAIGDAVALSITPAYLKQVGLSRSVAVSEKATINRLLHDALEKVAFLPFGKLIDEWRHRVFSGDIPPERYNTAWWELRAKYQGIGPASPRGEEFFDPGAKYHIPANVPYARYFLSTLLQYQFHRAMCRLSGHEGPLHTCSVYGNKQAGAKLKEMLALGARKPWPDALEVLTGQREIDASALLDYFAPLSAWLNEQNREKTCGF